MKSLNLLLFSQIDEEVKGESNMHHFEKLREAPHRFYEQHEVELMHK